MKFLIYSNVPEAPTGYGMQCGMLAEWLREHGHEVAIASSWGHQCGIASWRGIRVYPSPLTANHEQLHRHALHWFDGDPRAGWIIILTDVWSVTNPLLHEFNVLAWCPVDHDPVPPGVVEWFRTSCAKPVAMSQFGEGALRVAGFDPWYVPLGVDTAVFKPTPELTVNGKQVDARTYFEIPHAAFVVGMVAMNKNPADHKGFSEAFHGFAEFHQAHPNALLWVHTEPHGIMGGGDLIAAARLAGIPDEAIRFSDSYALSLGFSREMMAALYTSFDVLIAPSHGEGFCVPLVEAQACGVPVISTRWTSQQELVGPESGWLIGGQPVVDPSQRSRYLTPFVSELVEALEAAYGSDLVAMQGAAIEFASRYEVGRSYAGWIEVIAGISPPEAPEKPPLERIDVIVPFMRDDRYDVLRDSFEATNDGTATMWIVHDKGARLKVDAHPRIDTQKVHTSFAEKVNTGVHLSGDADWVAVVGDDCEFTPGWIEAARAASTRADVIGTNDSEEGRVRNPDVAAGRHADHFLIRRSYIENEGASLDGPGIAMPEVYGHWFVDKEVVGLARARGVYVHAEDCRIVHHHPGYDGREDLREQDPVYMRAVDTAEADRVLFMKRAPLIENHRVTR